MSGFSFEAVNNFFVHNPVFTVSVGMSALIATFLYIFGFSHMVKKEVKRRRMKYEIKHLKDHYIVCGLGRVGQQVVHELESEKEHFVIIERDENKLAYAKDHHWLYLHGDVALDESLFTQANIETARALIIAVGADADAIFMAVSARALNKNIFIVARASSVEAADKLTKIGVNRVALPYQIGGYHMANMALRPTVVDYLDLLVDQERHELEMEEYIIYDGDYFDGKMLKETDFVKDNLGVLAVRRKNGKSVINPGETVKLAGGDKLVVTGSETDLAELSHKVKSHQSKIKKNMSEESDPVMADVKPSPFINQE